MSEERTEGHYLEEVAERDNIYPSMGWYGADEVRLQVVTLGKAATL